MTLTEPRRITDGESRRMAKVIRYTEGCYEVQEVSFGRVYRWHPEPVVIQCDCGEGPILAGYKTTCAACDVDHIAIIREETAGHRVRHEAVHPSPGAPPGIPGYH